MRKIYIVLFVLPGLAQVKYSYDNAGNRILRENLGAACAFSISTRAAGSVNPATQVTIAATCSGTACSSVSYAWSGSGVSGTNRAVTFTASSTAGVYSYTVTASKTGCTSQTATVSMSVNSVLVASSFEGLVDAVSCDSVSGWVWDSAQPSVSLKLDILDNGSVITTGTATSYRADFESSGKGNGYHGFTIVLPASVRNGQSHLISVRVSGSSYQLLGGPTSNPQQ